ncbi:UDP-glucuronosyltransferase 2B31-like, partial [Ctenocephalides felis]|uniref:UDP-glucuronosyltransferase 2B31-like n=1 Tax=Ctenocephalides felis TaxID=7515 RepID=UPI000E6E2326
ILGLFPLNGPSHWAPAKALMEALAKKGHQVTVVTHFPRKEPLANYKEISLAGTLPTVMNNMSYSLVGQMGLIGTAFVVWHLTGSICVKCCIQQNSYQFICTKFQDLAASNEKYDLIVTETFGTDCFLGFVHKFQAPWVSLSCAIPMDWMAHQVDIPTIPSYVPHMMTNLSDRMDFWQRVRNFLMHIFTYYGYHYVSRLPSESYMSSTFPDAPPLQKLSTTPSLLLSNSHFSLTGARPSSPAHKEVGGLHITPEPAPLPQDLQKLLDGAKQGVVYFSFGSMVQSETIPQENLQIMLDTFSRLPHLVLWKANPKNFPQGLVVPKNVVTQPWLPQRDLLAHPNIKVFVTHGGLLGTMEAVYCGVPMVGVPLYGDQMTNVKNYVRKGIARMSLFMKFKKNSRRFLIHSKDRPIKPLDEAVYWTEYVIRHQGAPAMRTAARYLNWFALHSLDVVAFLFICILATLVVGICGCRLLRRCCRKINAPP